MTYRKILLVGLLLAAGLTGCGSVDRAALAHDTVVTYWQHITHAQFGAAYKMMTSGNRAAIPQTDFTQSYESLLANAGSIKFQVGTATVNDDQAVVPLTLTAAGNQKLHAYQHLYWENGHWRISDQNGGLARKP